ncbi:sushi domain-containing protein 2-like [Patiria miniata]|uniref:Sushi, nidogen and EGF-like domain-containing protein 1 n=1 Tax=Patiria miniata TaxID=46514 RepID=A0A913ZU42_PATMI|nr:sushi domain-containing protein 2-like [Patiria miniata]
MSMGTLRSSPSIVVLYLMVCFTLARVQDVASQEQDLFFPYGSSVGDKELPIEDDTGIELELPATISYFPFFDQNHRSLYVNTNGVVSFLQNVVQYTPESFPLGNDRRIIAPYWADVDVTNGGHVWYRQTTNDTDLLKRATDEVARVFAVDFRFEPFVAEWLLIVTWDKVAFYNSRTGRVNRENTFQAILITDSVYSFTIFNYGELQWTTGSASFGDKETGLGGDDDRAVPAQVGFNAGDGLNFYSVPNSQTDDILKINTTTNIRKPGRWMFRIDGKEIEAAGCQNDLDGNLRISPAQVIMLGGDVLSISGPCFDVSSDVFCRIQGYEIQASYDFTKDPFTVRCATPLFMALGESPVYLSKDGGQTYNYTGYITVVGMDRAPPRVVPSQDNDVLRVSWEKDGYPFTNSLSEDDVHVDVFLYSYTEDPNTNEVRLKPVLKIADNRKLSNGFDSLIRPQLAEPIDVGIYRVVEHGAVDISQPGISVVMGVPGTDPSQAPIPSMWSMPFNANPADDQADSNQWCRSWGSAETPLDLSGDNLPACPCTLRQAQADVGAFEPYPWCNQGASGDEKCPYRTSVVHCVRARRGSDQGRGQLCCYDNTENIVLLEDNYEGGSSQSHFNGGHAPAGYPGNVPYLSNFLGDRVPWEQCCPRTGYNPSSCDIYRNKRPSSDCKNYLPPKPAAVFGEPHFITFDGTKYIFNGYGEFTLVSAPGANLTMQGRMAQLIENVQATGLTVATMRVGDSDTIQVEITDRRKLDVWVRREARGAWQRLGFEQSGWWTARPRGAIVELIGAEESQGVRVIFDQGTAFEAKAPAGASAMAVKILAAPALQGGTTGLLGNWNSDPSDDLKAPNGAIFSVDSLANLHDFFGVKWYISRSDSLFRYDISVNVSTINRPNFQAVYTLDSTLTEEQLNSVCGDSEVCRYDYQKTSSPEMGTGAEDAEEDYEGTSNDTTPVVSCGFLEAPQGGSKSGTVYLSGSTLEFSCIEGYERTGSASRQCVQGVWQGNVTVCTPPQASMRDLMLIIIIAAVLGGILLLALCFLCVICCFRRKKRNDKDHADHELRTISTIEGIENGALVTTPLANDRTPSSNSSIIDDPNYEHTLPRNNHHDTAFPFADTGYMDMRGSNGEAPRRPARDRQLARPVDGPDYRGSAIASRGPGYRSAEEAVAGPSHAGPSTATARHVPSLSKQPKTRAEENAYDDPLEARQKMEKAKNMKGSIFKDPNTSHYDSDDSSDDEIARIKRKIRQEVEQEEEDDR